MRSFCNLGAPLEFPTELSTRSSGSDPGNASWLLSRRPLARSAARSTAATITGIVVIIWFLAMPPARADAVWDFQLTSGTWASSWDGPWTPNGYKWTWTGTATPSPLTGGTSPHWHILAQGVTASTPNAYYLTSPVISGLVGSGTAAVPAQNTRISIAHNFLLMMGTNGRPITTGQFEYQLNGSGQWLGLPLAAFTSGSVTDFNPVFGTSPFVLSGTTLRHVDQGAFVVPNYVTPIGSGSLPFVDAGKAAFTGTTPGWSTAYVPTQAYLNANTGLPSTGITTIQFRFTNLNLASNCGPGDGWNVRFVQVEFDSEIPPVPEPTGVALAATALAALAAAAASRRCRHQRPSRPNERPCTTTLPPVSVAPRIGSEGHRVLTPYCSGASARPPSQKMA